MSSVYRDYIRARAFRTRKAIIYSTCAGVLTLLLGLNLIHMLLVCVATWLAVWGLSTPRVKQLRRIHLLGGRR